MTDGLESLSKAEVQQIVHNLRVHEIELEAQNEALRHAHLELDALRARYFDLYDLAPVGYCTLNEHGLIVQANLNAATLFGTVKSALVNERLSRFVHREDQDTYYRYRKGVIEGGGGGSCELRIVRPDLTELWVELVATMGTETDGATAFRLILSDIGERKRREQETAMLQAQLQQAQKMESVGRLAGGVAHDFNNMLAVILGHIALALDGIEPSDPRADDLVQIQSAAQRSVELTRQLLAFARRQIIAPQVLSLNEQVAGMVRMLERLVGEGIALRFLPAPDLWMTKVDPSQVDQILANLSVNAKDAIGGTGTLTITTGNSVVSASQAAAHPGAAPGEYVQLLVGDDGCGMRSEVLSHLFEPFFTTKAGGHGTGLGLATVFGIVQQNTGFIEVSSKPGGGTTFSIYLPRCNDLKSDAAAPSPSPSACRHETVLLVEDEPALLAVTTTMLQRLGYLVIEANSPAAAVRAAKEHPGDIALLMTDVIMPGMNGRELSELLAPLRPEMKQLFMSGYAAEVIVSFEAGTSFLQKPFSRNDLATKLRALLDAEGTKVPS